MQITVELPDDLASRPDAARLALEAVAIGGYRTGTLSHRAAAELLELSRFEFDGFLKSRNIYDHAYDETDLARDIANLKTLKSRINQRA
jgi:predicted HTH domain antitoxin